MLLHLRSRVLVGYGLWLLSVMAWTTSSHAQTPSALADSPTDPAALPALPSAVDATAGGLASPTAPTPQDGPPAPAPSTVPNVVDFSQPAPPNQESTAPGAVTQPAAPANPTEKKKEPGKASGALGSLMEKANMRLADTCGESAPKGFLKAGLPVWATGAVVGGVLGALATSLVGFGLAAAVGHAIQQKWISPPLSGAPSLFALALLALPGGAVAGAVAGGLLGPLVPTLGFISRPCTKPGQDPTLRPSGTVG